MRPPRVRVDHVAIGVIVYAATRHLQAIIAATVSTAAPATNGAPAPTISTTDNDGDDCSYHGVRYKQGARFNDLKTCMNDLDTCFHHGAHNRRDACCNN